MGNNLLEIIEKAMQVLPENRRAVLDQLAKRGVVNLNWYLRTKIIAPPEEERLDHMRVLRYAYNFCLAGAGVTLVRESSVESRKTPDLEIEIPASRFFVEVRKFREGSATDPVSKIVEAATTKRVQLPDGGVGLVAIDNFDMRLEVGDGGILTHAHILDALCELERLATQHPEGWEKPGGVVFAANTTGGVVSPTTTSPILEIPHFVWINRQSSPPVPREVENFVLAALNKARLFDTDAMCGQAPELASLGYNVTTKE